MEKYISEDRQERLNAKLKQTLNNLNWKNNDVSKLKEYFRFYVNNLIMSNKYKDLILVSNYKISFSILKEIEKIFKNDKEKTLDFLIFLKNQFNNKNLHWISVLSKAIEFINKK